MFHHFNPLQCMRGKGCCAGVVIHDPSRNETRAFDLSTTAGDPTSPSSRNYKEGETPLCEPGRPRGNQPQSGLSSSHIRRIRKNSTGGQ